MVINYSGRFPNRMPPAFLIIKIFRLSDGWAHCLKANNFHRVEPGKW